MPIDWDDSVKRFRDVETGRFVSKSEGLQDTWAAHDYYLSHPDIYYEEGPLEDLFPPGEPWELEMDVPPEDWWDILEEAEYFDEEDEESPDGED